MAHLEIPAAGSPEANAALTEGLRALQDALRLPDLEGAASDPPPALVLALSRWWEAYDRYLEVVVPTLDVSCGRGCSSCCLDNPRGVSGVELWWLQRTLPSDLRGSAAPLARAFQERIDRVGRDRAHKEIKKRKTPCMYLGDDGACRVHPARPVGCRMFFAITPADWCRPTHRKHRKAVNPHLIPPQVIQQLLLAISERMGLGDLPRDLRRGMAALEESVP